MPGAAETAPDAGGIARRRRQVIPPIYRPVLLAAALLVLGLLFRELVTLLLAVLVTVILAIPLSAVATFLERWRVPRAAGALIGLLLGVLALAGVIALVITPLVGQVESFVDQVPATVDSASRAFADVTGSGETQLGDSIQSWLQGYIDQPERLAGTATTVGLGVAGALAALILIVITAYYMAVRPDPLVTGALRLVPPPYRERARAAMDRLRTAWIGWMKGVVVDMAVTGVLLYVGLMLIGLDFALLFAAISALLVVIPYFGSIVGAIPPVLFALADSPSKALLALGVYVLVQQVESNVIIPLVMARTTKLHPALVAIGVVVVGQLFGFLGLFVAVPILSTIVVLTQEAWVRPIEESSAEHDVQPPDAAGSDPGYESEQRPASSTSERTPKPDAPLPT